MGTFTSFLSLFTIGMNLLRNGFEMKEGSKEKEEEKINWLFLFDLGVGIYFSWILINKYLP